MESGQESTLVRGCILRAHRTLFQPCFQSHVFSSGLPAQNQSFPADKTRSPSGIVRRKGSASLRTMGCRGVLANRGSTVQVPSNVSVSIHRRSGSNDSPGPGAFPGDNVYNLSVPRCSQPRIVNVSKSTANSMGCPIYAISGSLFASRVAQTLSMHLGWPSFVRRSVGRTETNESSYCVLTQFCKQLPSEEMAHSIQPSGFPAQSTSLTESVYVATHLDVHAEAHRHEKRDQGGSSGADQRQRDSCDR